jgi:hypothetical protein
VIHIAAPDGADVRHREPDGSFLHLYISSIQLHVVGVYAPADADRRATWYPRFCTFVSALCSSLPRDEQLMCVGDWNLPLLPHLDTSHARLPERARDLFQRTMAELQLADPWRVRNPQEAYGTYLYTVDGSERWSRLDYAMLTPALLHSSKDWRHRNVAGFQHRAVTGVLIASHARNTGRGIWRVKDAVLRDDRQLLKDVRTLIQFHTPTLEQHPHLAHDAWQSLSSDLKWVCAKAQAKATWQRRQQLDLLTKALLALDDLDADVERAALAHQHDPTFVTALHQLRSTEHGRYLLNRSHLFVDLPGWRTSPSYTVAACLRADVPSIRDHLLTARADAALAGRFLKEEELGLSSELWQDESFRNWYETNSSRQREKSFVEELRRKHDADASAEPAVMLATMSSYWTEEIWCDPADTPLTQSQRDTWLNFLTPQQREAVEGQADMLKAPISTGECYAAVKALNRSSAPGIDGLTAALFQSNCEAWVRFLTPFYHLCVQRKAFPESVNSTVITSVFKGGPVQMPELLARSLPEFYRPLSLPTTCYKVFALVLLHRLKCVVQAIVHPCQTGFMPGRDISTSVTTLWLWMKHTDWPPTGDDGFMFMQDYRKAYERVQHIWLETVLCEGYCFPPEYCRMLQLTYSGTVARFLLNGHLSEPVLQRRGLKEGCPLSPLLFVLCIEPLLARVRVNCRAGLAPMIGLVAFADDVNVLLANAAQLKVHLDLVSQFTEVSGLDLNPSKCVLVPRSAACSDRPSELTATMRFLNAEEAAAGATPAKTLGLFVVPEMRQDPTSAHILTKIDQSLFFALRRRWWTAMEKSMHQRARMMAKAVYDARIRSPPVQVVTKLESASWHLLYGLTPRTREIRKSLAGHLGWERAQLRPKHAGYGFANPQETLFSLVATAIPAWYAQQSLPLAEREDWLQLYDRFHRDWRRKQHHRWLVPDPFGCRMFHKYKPNPTFSFTDTKQEQMLRAWFLVGRKEEILAWLADRSQGIPLPAEQCSRALHKLQDAQNPSLLPLVALPGVEGGCPDTEAMRPHAVAACDMSPSVISNMFYAHRLHRVCVNDRQATARGQVIRSPHLNRYCITSHYLTARERTHWIDRRNGVLLLESQRAHFSASSGVCPHGCGEKEDWLHYTWSCPLLQALLGVVSRLLNTTPIQAAEWNQHGPHHRSLCQKPWRLGLARLAYIWHQLRDHRFDAPQSRVRHAIERWALSLRKLHTHARQLRRRSTTTMEQHQRTWSGYDSILALNNLTTTAPHRRLHALIRRLVRPILSIPLLPRRDSTSALTMTPSPQPIATPLIRNASTAVTQPPLTNSAQPQPAHLIASLITAPTTAQTSSTTCLRVERRTIANPMPP